MTMTTLESLIIIGAAAAGTMVTRFLPFLIFPENKPVPKFVTYLSDALPLSVMAMIVVYTLRKTSLVSGSHGLPEIIALLVLTGVHLKWRNTLVSIGVGTLVYMLLVQFVFVS